MNVFDHIIVGTGQATGTLLGGLLHRDESIAVIEGKNVGGTCVNTGCTPTKTLVASAKTANMVRRAGEYGVETENTRVNFSKVMERMNELRHSNSDGFENWLRSDERITFYKEWAKFESDKQVRVGGEVIEGKNIYINVGARARKLPISGIDEVDWLDNERLLELDELPDHLVIIGGSYIGLEFGQMFRRFGSEVTVLEAAPQIMSREDEDVAEEARSILQSEGITLHEGVKVELLEQKEEKEIEIEISVDGEKQRISGSHLLLAAGRVPNSDTLQLGNTSIEPGQRGFIPVDDYCKTSVDGVYAVGDVNGKGAFTHTSVNDAEIVLDQLRGGDRKISDRIPVYAMFIDPPLGRVGMSEKEALDSGKKVLKATRPMSKINRAKEMGETNGFAKLLVDAETDKILGATVFGPGGDEIINMFAAYMYSDLPCRAYRKSVLVHPTISELMPWILDDLKPVN